MQEYNYPKTSIKKVPKINRNKKIFNSPLVQYWLHSDSYSPYYAVNLPSIITFFYLPNRMTPKKTTKKVHFLPTISNMVKIRFHHLEYDAVTFTVISWNCKSIDLEHWLLITLIDTHSVLYVQGFFSHGFACQIVFLFIFLSFIFFFRFSLDSPQISLMLI